VAVRPKTQLRYGVVHAVGKSRFPSHRAAGPVDR